jgi:hypothetical protein
VWPKEARKEALEIAKRTCRMTSDMTLSGSFLDSRQMQQEVLMWLLHNAGMDVTPRNCIRVSTRQNITEEFSREGRRGRNMRGADWIRGTFGFEVTECVSTLRLCLLVEMILEMTG